MPEFDNVYLQRGSMIAGRAAALAKTRRGRRIGITVLVLLLIFSIGGFLVVPHVLRGILTGQVATSLHRPVTVGTIRFNPYRLRLQVNDLQVGGHGNEKPLAAFVHLDVKAGWSSLFRLKPIVKEVTLDRPAVKVVRKADGTFNFSDLLTPSASPSPRAPSKPLKFQVSNIRILDGDVTFDDEKVGSHHEIKQLELDVPFIANLPGKIDYVVQPSLKMDVDGTPVRVQGASRPFGDTHDSAFTLAFHRIDLAQFMSYLPPSMALKLPSGALSIDLLLHFREANTGPSIVLDGAVAVDQLDLRDSSNAPVLAVDHGEVKVAQLGPLDRVAYLSEVALIGLKANLVRSNDGALNVATMFGASPARKEEAAPAPAPAAPAPAAPAPAPAPAAPAAAAQPGKTQAESAPFDVAVDSIKVIGSAVSYTDLGAATPASAALEGLNAQVNNLRLSGQLPADYQLAANLHTGGTVGLKGSLELAKSNATADLALDQVDLAGIQTFAQSFFAGTLNSGKLSAHGTLKTHFASDQFNLHAEPADLAIDNLAIKQPRLKDAPIAWTHFGVTLDNFDLASRQVEVKEVRSDGIKLFVQRSKGGQLSLAELMNKPAPPAPESRGRATAKTEREQPNAAKPAAEPSAPPWRYRVESIALENTDARFEDYATPKVVRTQLAPLNIHLKDVSSDFAKPIGIQIDGVRNRRGTFKVDGNAAIDPLNADLRVETRNLDMAAVNNYVSTKLNAQLTSAELTMKAQAGVQQVGKDYHVKYRGDLALNNFAAIDKATGDNFVDWKSAIIRGVDAEVGEGEPKVHVGSIALANFDGRLILNSSGKLNLSDIVAQPNAAPKSLTRENVEGAQVAPSPAAPAPTATPAPGAAAHPLNADLMVDKVTLEGGHVYYTDDFIKPNYSADLTNISGSIGAFGTSTQQPADVELQGQVNGSAPLNISGSVNPLSPLAYVDIKAKAQGIELTGLSAYSTKYTGYPIIKGSLNVNVHYLLNQGALTANNHIFIDQLTFGDRVENSSARNLPVRFAVAVLKNSRGEIDLNIPVSGSLSDPQFSIGSVIWHAFLNVITKAVTAPFSLLASAVGAIAGGGGGSDTGSTQDLSYVAFNPGFATLTGSAKNGLTTLGNALRDRPALHLSICGRVDPDKDLQGLREAWVAEQIRAQKARDVGGDPQSVEVTQGDYDKYLERAYDKAKIPKPRNLIGLAKDLPNDEMKKLMLEHAPVSKDDLPKLADGRATVVRQYLGATVPAERLSVVAPKLTADGITNGATTRADLALH